MMPSASNLDARPPWARWTPFVCKWLTVLLWVLPVLVITILVIHMPFHRSVTLIYHEASKNWWERKNLYSGPGGMNYLPHFAVVFTPFQKLPVPTGDILWRLCAAGLLANGLWQFVRRHFGDDAPRAFLWVTVLALPVSLPALRNGQANAMFGALTLQAAAAMVGQRWTGATLWILLALAVKPLGMVMLLLAPFAYAPLRWRLATGLAVLALSPFLFAPPEYVLAQYQGMLQNLQFCSAVTEHRFADIGGIARTFGYEMAPLVSKGIRVCAGGVVLVLWRFGARRLPEPMAAMWLLTLSTGYLMLFNPMTEANSYVIVAPALGLWAVYMLGNQTDRRTGCLLSGIALSIGCLPNLLRPFFGNGFALIWHPTMTVIFLFLLARCVWAQKPRIPILAAQHDAISP